MKKTSKSLVFFGSGPVAAASLKNLHDNFSVEFVLTKNRPSHHKDIAPVEDFCIQNKIKIIYANNSTDLESSLSNNNIDSILGVVIDYGVIIPQSVMGTFPLGIINSHFSLLPEWRGADPITYCLLSGQKQTGVSLMLIEEGLDTGPLIAQQQISIEANDDNASLTNKLIKLSNQLLINNIERYLAKTVNAYPQKSLPITYSKKISKDDKAINTTKPAYVIEREIRAYKTWPRSVIKLKSYEVIVTKATVSDKILNIGNVVVENKRIFVGCRVGSLELIELQLPGKKPMSSESFINGYSKLLL
jgi:methionyl-tRNA formyltransferase